MNRFLNTKVGSQWIYSKPDPVCAMTDHEHLTSFFNGMVLRFLEKYLFRGAPAIRKIDNKKIRFTQYNF